MRKVIKRVFFIFNDISDYQIGVYAASGAFFMFLSLVPISVLVCSILPYTPLTEGMVLDYLSAVIPQSMHELMNVIVRDVYGSTIAAMSISALFTLWSASKAFMGLMRGLNVIYKAQTPKNYFKVRARSGVSTLMLLIITIVSLVLIVFEQKILNAVVTWWPNLETIANYLLNFRFIVVILLLTFVFMMMYKWMLWKRVKFLAQTPGALVAALLWMILSWIFSFYFRKFNSFSTYGSLTTIIITMLWMFYCMYIILVGAYVNAHIVKHKQHDYRH